MFSYVLEVREIIKWKINYMLKYLTLYHSNFSSALFILCNVNASYLLILNCFRYVILHSFIEVTSNNGINFLLLNYHKNICMIPFAS